MIYVFSDHFDIIFITTLWLYTFMWYRFLNQTEHTRNYFGLTVYLVYNYLLIVRHIFIIIA